MKSIIKNPYYWLIFAFIIGVVVVVLEMISILDTNIDPKINKKIIIYSKILYIIDLIAFGISYYLNIYYPYIEHRKQAILKLVKITFFLLPTGAILLFREINR